MRIDSRRDWNSVQFDVDVSSRYLPWVGIHASQSNLRAAEEPRSPEATSMTRNGSSSAVSHCFSHASSRWCSACGVLGRDVREHLDLVELVHAEDAAGVLAVRAGLAAEAGREARVAQRQLVRVDDLVHVVRRERHLGGADQVEVVLVEVVDVLGGLAEEAGALHRLRADQRRRQHRGEAGGGGLRHRRVAPGPAPAGRRRRSGSRSASRRPWRRARRRSRRAAGRAPGGPWARSPRRRSRGACRCVSRVTKSSSPPTGTSGCDEVRRAASSSSCGLGVGRVALGVGGLDVGGELARLLQQLGLLVARRPWG